MDIPSLDSTESLQSFVNTPVELVASELAQEVVSYFGGPKDLQSACEFIKEKLKPGAIFVYGAGTHSRAILGALASRTDITVTGFIDQRAIELGEFEGRPIIVLEDLAAQTFDYVLISYNRIEKKMVDRLQAAGVPIEKIVPIYSNPEFMEIATVKRLERYAARLDNGKFDFIIVRTGVHEVLSDHFLMKIFPPERTLMVHIGPADNRPTEEFFWSVDVQESMSLLAAILRRVQPKIVYAATAREYDLCSFVVKDAVPNAYFIHEVYDFFSIIPEDWLKWGVGATDRLIELMRLSTIYSARVADMVVSKRGGRAWKAARDDFRADYEYIFPGVGAEADPARCCLHSPTDIPPSEPLRLLYAGALVPSNFDVFRRSDYNFMPLLRELADDWGVSIDVYNSSHWYTKYDDLFRLYLDSYNSGNLRYFHRIPYDYLLGMTRNYHYGWLCLPKRERRLVDQSVVICNRFTAYIFGCLPVIVDREWTFIADLVEEFDAGIVVDDVSASSVMAAIRGADNARKRQGAHRLAEHMQTHNCAVLERLRKLAAGMMPAIA